MKRKGVILLGLGVAILAAGAFFLLGSNPAAALKSLYESTLSWARQTHPAAFVVALGILPLGPFPVSALWLIAGSLYGPGPGLAFCALGCALNLLLAYGLCHLLRGPLLGTLARRGIQVPQARAGEYLKVALAFRITPGVPLFLQNYVLGLAGIPLRIYLAVSIPVQLAYAAAFVLLGDSIFRLRGGKLIAIGCVIAVVTIAVSLIRSRISKPNNSSAAPRGDLAESSSKKP
jgi:uncharacterized membrane protein YdjX (TVP38/TMEM64 family)